MLVCGEQYLYEGSVNSPVKLIDMNQKVVALIGGENR